MMARQHVTGIIAMSAPFKVACIQNCAGPETAPNLAECAGLVRAAAADGAQLLCLPEYFTGLDQKDGLLLPDAYPEEGHPALPLFGELASELGVWLLLGSLAIKEPGAIEGPGGKIFNRSFLLDSHGRIAARYDKLHLFDVRLAGGERYTESATIAPGDRAVVAETPWGSIGLSVCYDLRFPQLYRALAQAGAGLLTVPAAFTRTTGEAHWHVLLRARAIECGAYVIAPCQCGVHAGGAATYGHSLIVDPWGRVLADGGEEVGHVTAEIDPGEVAKARQMIPSLTHDRPFSPPAPQVARRAEIRAAE